MGSGLWGMPAQRLPSSQALAFPAQHLNVVSSICNCPAYILGSPSCGLGSQVRHCSLSLMFYFRASMYFKDRFPRKACRNLLQKFTL